VSLPGGGGNTRWTTWWDPAGVKCDETMQQGYSQSSLRMQMRRLFPLNQMIGIPDLTAQWNYSLLLTTEPTAW